MNYQIKCNVFLGMGCCGMSCGDTDYVTVDLTDDEANQIREHIDPDDDHILNQIKTELPDIYEKISDKVISYVYFVVANDARESGLWQDCIRSGRDIDDFIQEDIDKGAIDDTDEEGNPLSEDEVYRLWNKYEDEHIHSLPYNEAYNYIIERYECEPDNIDCIDYSIELPDELQA